MAGIDPSRLRTPAAPRPTGSSAASQAGSGQRPASTSQGAAAPAGWQPKADARPRIPPRPAASPATTPAAATSVGATIESDDAFVDGTFNASEKGQAPGPRPTASDFVAQAKAQGVAPAEVDEVAGARARAAIEAEFGVSVKNGSRTWSTEELCRLHESLSKLPAGDRAKLRGLTLTRDGAAPREVQAKHPDGTVAALYQPNAEVRDGERVKPGAIAFYDESFPEGPDGRRTSTHDILHEVGHAVVNRSRDDAVVGYRIAKDRKDAAQATFNQLREPAAQAWDEVQKSQAIFKPTEPGARAFAAAQLTLTKALDQLQRATTPAELEKAKGAVAQATSARDAALASLEPEFRTEAKLWVTDTDALGEAALALGTAHVEATAAEAAFTAAKAGVDAVASPARGGPAGEVQAKELDAFTRARGKEPAVSGYGESGAGEAFAEAYALFQRDPDFMRTHYHAQYDFFAARQR